MSSRPRDSTQTSLPLFLSGTSQKLFTYEQSTSLPLFSSLFAPHSKASTPICGWRWRRVKESRNGKTSFHTRYLWLYTRKQSIFLLLSLSFSSRFRFLPSLSFLELSSASQVPPPGKRLLPLSFLVILIGLTRRPGEENGEEKSIASLLLHLPDLLGTACLCICRSIYLSAFLPCLHSRRLFVLGLSPCAKALVAWFFVCAFSLFSTGPYSYEIVPFAGKNRQDYLTLSARGVTHYKEGGDVEFIPLQTWEKDQQKFRKIISINFFASYQKWRMISIWKRVMREVRFKSGKLLPLSRSFCFVLETVNRRKGGGRGRDEEGAPFLDICR